jgi:lysozyme
MTRKINDDGLKLIKQWEGLRTTAYRDTGGVLTIGYGHTSDATYPVKLGMVVTEAKAEEMLRYDLSEAEETVERLVKVPLNDNQFATLVSFVFNLGEPQFSTSTLLKKLNAGDYGAVPAELARWVHDNGKKIDGLVNRRAAEAGLWAKGSFVSSNTVEAKPAPAPTLTKENISWGAGILASLTSLLSGAGPVQWALGGVIVVAFAIGAVLFLKNRLAPS